jgi:hypothetical protein
MLQGTSKRTFGTVLVSRLLESGISTYISDEVDGQSEQVLVASDVQALRQAIQLGIRNCTAVIVSILVSLTRTIPGG